MILFKINSKTLSRNPSDINQSQYKITKTDRTVDGTLVTDIIAVKNKVSFTWDYMSTADLKKLSEEINNNGFLVIEYYSPEQNELKIITAQSGDISYSPHYDSRTQAVNWKDVKVSFEER